MDKKERVEQFLKRGIAEIYPSKELFKKVLLSNKKLSIYIGVDATGPEIHIGHAVGLWKLRELQEMGHQIILLIGDFTGMIGDPSGRDTTRKPLTKEQTRENAKKYKEQVSKILAFKNTKNPAKIVYNSKWLSKVSLSELLKLASNFTFQQFIERDMFQKRIKEGKPIFLHELLYPLMQAYDGFSLKVDAELGGTDQTFNMLIGRELINKLLKKEKFVITVPLLTGLDGRKMSKSYFNTIPIRDLPNDMFAKVMSVKDSLIPEYFELATNVEENLISEVKADISNGKNQFEWKKRLAFEVVKRYHGEKSAKKAEIWFVNTIQNKQFPSDAKRVYISKKSLNIIDLLTSIGAVSTKSEAKRIVTQGGVDINGNQVKDKNEIIKIGKDIKVKVGKHKFYIISVKK
uniref:Tyrosine--tRNA ligase n=1 Tax=candidate division CPR3 bacterium TaxID=2268181 RepID=A0A7C5Z364_UNCC3